MLEGYGTSAAAPGMPDLDFAIEGSDVLEFAAAPTLKFALGITSRGGVPIRSIALTTQIRIAPAQRSYEASEQARLMELFGEPERWGATMHTLLWAHVTLSVPAFMGSTLVDLPVPCTYDVDVAAANYFHGVTDGDIPLEFLFSGTVFYSDERGLLQTVRIAMDKEARTRLPVGVWRAMMAHYFPNDTWLRLRQDVFDRLHLYRASRALGTWEETIETLLRNAERGEGE